MWPHSTRNFNRIVASRVMCTADHVEASFSSRWLQSEKLNTWAVFLSDSCYSVRRFTTTTGQLKTPKHEQNNQSRESSFACDLKRAPVVRRKQSVVVVPCARIGFRNIGLDTTMLVTKFELNRTMVSRVKCVRLNCYIAVTCTRCHL